MAEKTVVLRLRLTENDLKALESAANGQAPSVYARKVLAGHIKGFSGTVNPQGGKRAGAGRRKLQDAV